MILSTLDKSRKGGAYEQIPSLVLGQRWTPQLNSRNMMKVVLCVWIEPYIETDLSFCVWPVHTPTTSKEVLTLSASTSPLPYTGNKSCIVNTILSVMPKHTVYIDPCMGSAKVFFRKPRAEKEILNDYNGDLVNLFRVIQNNEKLAYLLGRLYLSINGELAFKQNKDMDEYDTIFVEFPIWWYIAPTIVNAFLESYDLTGKTIIPFATSGGSGMGKTNEALKPSCTGATLLEGKVWKSTAKKEELSVWADSLACR